MESCGRIQCALIATSGSHVIYERFYERFTDEEKAAIRSAFQTAQKTLSPEKPEAVGRLRYFSDGMRNSFRSCHDLTVTMEVVESRSVPTDTPCHGTGQWL